MGDRDSKLLKTGKDQLSANVRKSPDNLSIKRPTQIATKVDNMNDRKFLLTGIG